MGWVASTVQWRLAATYLDDGASLPGTGEAEGFSGFLVPLHGIFKQPLRAGTSPHSPKMLPPYEARRRGRRTTGH